MLYLVCTVYFLPSDGTGHKQCSYPSHASCSIWLASSPGSFPLSAYGRKPGYKASIWLQVSTSLILSWPQIKRMCMVLLITVC